MTQQLLSELQAAVRAANTDMPADQVVDHARQLAALDVYGLVGGRLEVVDGSRIAAAMKIDKRAVTRIATRPARSGESPDEAAVRALRDMGTSPADLLAPEPVEL